jgi:hypothetical protein
MMDRDAPRQDYSTESAFARAVLSAWIRSQLGDRYKVERDAKLPDVILEQLALNNDPGQHKP